jgi:hypothetical protein
LALDFEPLLSVEALFSQLLASIIELALLNGDVANPCNNRKKPPAACILCQD